MLFFGITKFVQRISVVIAPLFLGPTDREVPIAKLFRLFITSVGDTDVKCQNNFDDFDEILVC